MYHHQFPSCFPNVPPIYQTEEISVLNPIFLFFGRRPQKSEEGREGGYWCVLFGAVNMEWQTNWEKKIVVQDTLKLWFGVLSWSRWVSCTQCHFVLGVTTRPMKQTQGKHEIWVQLLKICPKEAGGHTYFEQLTTEQRKINLFVPFLNCSAWPCLGPASLCFAKNYSPLCMIGCVNGSLGLGGCQFLVSCNIAWAACLAGCLCASYKQEVTLAQPKGAIYRLGCIFMCLIFLPLIKWLIHMLAFSGMPTLTRTTTSQTPWPSPVRDDQSYFKL